MRDLLNEYYIVKKDWRFRKQIKQSFKLQQNQNQDTKIQFYNWWPDDSHSRWLYDFIVQRGLLENTNKAIALCSVFDEKPILEHVDTDIRIFFSGENLHNPRHAQYADYMLSGKKPFDLALGFDYFEHEKYLRFPLWLTYMFAPNATEDDIRSRCKELRYPQINNKSKFASLIARYDWNGIRSEIFDSLRKIGDIDCPSALLYNDDTLLNQFQDDKTAYLKQYKFNICPENTNAYGYVTEKLFEAISAGCIPIYWGNYNMPEDKILNKDAILFWEKDGNNDKLFETINLLVTSESEYQYFANQPRLLNGAEEIIIAYFNILELRIRKLLNVTD